MKFYDGNYYMKKKDYDDIERRVRAFRAANNVHFEENSVNLDCF